MVSKGKATRRMILDRAMAEASLVGLEGLSIGGMAKEVGMSKSGLFAHFDSKVDLQQQVLRIAIERFIEAVIAPAFQQPRGEPRFRALFKNWLHWEDSDWMPGGCLFISMASELDDRPGELRDLLVESQTSWMEALAKAARLGVDEGHFRSDLDCPQVAYELYSIILAYHHCHRLLRDPMAQERVHRAFERLISDARKSRS